MTWMKKKASPSIHNITTVEEAERILSAEPKVVLAFLDSLVVCNFQNLSSFICCVYQSYPPTKMVTLRKPVRTSNRDVNC